MDSAWRGGLDSGLLATTRATMVANYPCLPSVSTFTRSILRAMPLSLFVLQEILISVLVEAHCSLRKRTEAYVQEARTHQEPLRCSEERFRLVVDRAKDYGILVLDPEGASLGGTRVTKRVYGHTEQEVSTSTYRSSTFPKTTCASPRRRRCQ